MNSKGQFSIIAALLVAVVLIGTVITTYATLRYSTIQDQPQVLSAIDETNLALEKVLGFTVGYYGSVLQVTGDAAYAKDLTTNYLNSSLNSIADINPEWSTFFSLTALDLSANWFTNTSYSVGQAVVAYDLIGLGISGMSYNASCRLDVQVLNSSVSSKACLNVTKDGSEPLTNLGKENFKFYQYQYSNLTWNYETPSGELTAFANGTYLIDIPPDIDPSSFVVQVTDTRGIMVAAASFSRLTFALMWNTAAPTGGDYVDINTTDVDLSPNKGTQSNFTAQQYGPDLINDTLREASTVNPPESIAKVGTDTSGTGNASPLSFSHTLVAGTNRLVVVSVGIENNGNYDVASVTYEGQSMTKAVDKATGTTGYIYLCEIWYILEANLPSNGAKTVTITGSGTASFDMEINGFCAEYTGVNQTAPEATDSDTVGAVATITSTVTPSSDAWVISAVGSGNAGSYSHNASQVEVLDFSDYSSQFAVAELRGGSGVTVGLNSTFSGTLNRQARVAASFKSYAGSTTYRLDIEEQWTNVNYTNPRQDLCIMTGNLSLNEALMVDVRSGSSWIMVINPLLANQWNNVSVTQYIGSLNFTIRFRDSGSPDTVQDSWNIDAVLLRPQPALDFLSLQNSTDATITIELLQNGTMRWLGQNLNLTTQEKPVPPVPVKAIHVNQTINGVNQEVPFQVEDWASEYRIPLGLTSNATVFSNRQMIVFLVNVNVSKVTVWWDGRDTATQTSLAYTNRYFSYTESNRTLSNSKLAIQFSSSGFVVTSILGSTQSTANFTRINLDVDDTPPELAYVIVNGTVRAIVQGEPEWTNGVANCSNVYANIVYTLPANATYYTYQLRLIFVNSTGRPRTITDLCPIKLSTTSSVTIQTENGTLGTSPIVATGTGTFKNYGASGTWTAHHWSQFNSTTGAGAGIMFTDSTNQLLYAFDPTATGSLNVSTTIEFSPVTQSLGQVSNFTTPNMYDITWHGAVATFNSTATPIYTLQGTTPTGLWLLVEYPPNITVTTET